MTLAEIPDKQEQTPTVTITPATPPPPPLGTHPTTVLRQAVHSKTSSRITKPERTEKAITSTRTASRSNVPCDSLIHTYWNEYSRHIRHRKLESMPGCKRGRNEQARWIGSAYLYDIVHASFTCERTAFCPKACPRAVEILPHSTARFFS